MDSTRAPRDSLFTFSTWLPDYLLLLQQYFVVDQAQGMCAWNSWETNCCTPCQLFPLPSFNLCPSEVYNPEGVVESHCAVPAVAPAKPVEFDPYTDVPAEAFVMGEKIMAVGGPGVAGFGVETSCSPKKFPVWSNIAFSQLGHRDLTSRSALQHPKRPALSVISSVSSGTFTQRQVQTPCSWRYLSSSAAVTPCGTRPESTLPIEFPESRCPASRRI